jgi:hypothetical protein
MRAVGALGGKIKELDGDWHFGVNIRCGSRTRWAPRAHAFLPIIRKKSGVPHAMAGRLGFDSNENKVDGGLHQAVPCHLRWILVERSVGTKSLNLS